MNLHYFKASWKFLFLYLKVTYIVPKNVSLHYYLAATYEENKNLDKAIQAVNYLVILAKEQNHKSLSYYQKYQEELLNNK
ncbi:MAG: tetratricopeptide repeat protein [Colwellia sp.]